MKMYNIGMFGCGYIAGIFTKAIDALDNRVVKYSVASRDSAHAKKFMKEFGFLKYHETYELMLLDEKIDFVYIATPTGVHYECIKMCLNAGKHVIVEKPITCNSAQLKEVLEMAENRNLILFDAIWSLYTPMFNKLIEIIKDEAIGKKINLFASFGYPGIKSERLMESNGGGALLDKGIYCIAFANKIMQGNGRILKVKNIRKQVDIDNKFYIGYKNGRAICHSSILHRTSYLLIIYGRKGIILSRKFWNGNSFIVLKFPFSIKRYKFIYKANAYECELKEMIKLLDNGKIESAKLMHKESIKNMMLIDAIIKY